MATALTLLASATARAQADPAHDAREDAVRQIMDRLELVELGLSGPPTVRALFAEVPALRDAAEVVIREAARASAVATTSDGAMRVDVVVPGSAIQARLERVAAAGLPPKFQDVSFAHVGSRGRRYQATGKGGGGALLPPRWAAVSEADRGLAVAAARLQALTRAVAQLADFAVQRGLPGAPDLAAVVGEAEWVRARARHLLPAATDLRAPSFRDDGTVVALVQLPAAALLAVLGDERGAQALPADTRVALARGLAGLSGTGQGAGRAPGAGTAERPRVLWAEASGRPAAGAQGPQVPVTARRAAEEVARARLVEQLRRVAFDDRRTVGDVLRATPALESSIGRFIAANAREVESRAVGADRWYIKLELNLDGLDAALK